MEREAAVRLVADDDIGESSTDVNADVVPVMSHAYLPEPAGSYAVWRPAARLSKWAVEWAIAQRGDWTIGQLGNSATWQLGELGIWQGTVGGLEGAGPSLSVFPITELPSCPIAGLSEGERSRHGGNR